MAFNRLICNEKDMKKQKLTLCLILFVAEGGGKFIHTFSGFGMSHAKCERGIDSQR